MGRKRKRSSWGSVTEVRRGVWRLRYYAETPQGYKRCTEMVHGTRTDADDRLAELRLCHSKDAPAPTVAMIWNQFMYPDYERMVAAGDRAEGTLLQYRSLWSAHVEPYWGDKPCDQIRPLEVQQWLYSLNSTAAEGSLKVLRPCLDYAVRYEYINANPFRAKYLMPSKTTIKHSDNGIWDLQQLASLWNSIHGEWFEGAFVLAAFGGLRVGEALGVLFEDIQDASRDGIPMVLVQVERQVRNNGELSERLKTAQSYREVPIVGKAAEWLLKAENGSAWLTTNGLGSHSTQATLVREWNRCGAEHPFRNLRNSWQTWMRWEAKVPPHFIEPMMGHVVPGVSGEYYDRPSSERLAEVLAESYKSCRWDKKWDISVI